MIIAVIERIARADGKLNVTFKTDGVNQKTMGAPNLPDAELIAWMVMENVKMAAEKAEINAIFVRKFAE